LNVTNWLGLMIGNSRLHWSYFEGKNLKQTWNTAQADSLTELPQVLNQELKGHLLARIPLYVASVVPSATKIYLPLSQTITINSSLIPLKNVYTTMGIDRLLALWGGGYRYGFPALVVDSGTALTFTGADFDHSIIGGAILPGVRLQLKSLFFNTASLPEIDVIGNMTPRWANNTPCAIQSGVIYSIVAGIKDFTQDWLRLYPESRVILTGGDALLLSQYINYIYPDFGDRFIVDSNLIFYGMENYRTLLDTQF
jgi:type III pantothenate kinase